MNMTVTESDRKLLSFLAAFVLAILFIFFIFKPLSEKNDRLEEEIYEAKQQEISMDMSASLAGDMAVTEQTTREQMGKVLQRFYPMLKSNEAGNMVTVLMLNHGLRIQNLAITMPEKESSLKWYQYSVNAQPDVPDEVLNEQNAESTLAPAESGFGVYTARVTCTAVGEKEKLDAFVDDISDNYPAISILAAEWSVMEQSAAETNPAAEAANSGEEADGEAAEDVIAGTVTQKTGSLTITLEIYMCNQ